jgi:hypothetical protein
VVFVVFVFFHPKEVKSSFPDPKTPKSEKPTLD